MKKREVKKRILIVASFPPPLHGSAVVSQYIKESKVINGSFICDYVNLSTSRKMDEIGKDSPFKVLRLVFALLKEFFLLLTHRYALCYLAITCHGKGFLKDAPFVLLCKLFGRKIVIHQHNKGMSRDIGRWPYSWLLPLCYKNAKVILLSWKLYPDAKKVVRKENVYICSNGISDVRIATKIASPSVPRLLFLSNLMISKGVYVLLDSLKILNDNGCVFCCDIIGEETKEINAMKLKHEIAKRGLQNVINYHGVKYGAEKEQILCEADIFVHPTLDDCFPLVLLEAMKYKLPIVATDVGGISDMIKNEENGLICERNNPVEFAKCIQILLDDADSCRTKGAKGKALFDRLFTLDVFERSLCGILENVIE